MTRKLSATERMLLAALGPAGEMMEGYTIAFGEEVLRHHGLRGFIEWSRLGLKARRMLRKSFGNRGEHLMSCFASFWNGCGYCAYGNLLAHNLDLFRERGEVFPLRVDELEELHEKRDAEVIALLEERLRDYPEELRLIKRQYALKCGAEPQGEEDESLMLSLHLLDFVNECSIVVDPPAPAFSRLAKDEQLVARYDEARKRA